MDTIQYTIFLVGVIFCAYRAIASKRILSATLYLAGVSALISAVIYKLGAAQVAVIELSVGAGLVTVLLVYALNVVGDDALDPSSIISKPLALSFVILLVAMLGWMVYESWIALPSMGAIVLADVLWQQRVLDVWVQIALIFSGVMGVLGLLSEQIATRQGGLN